MQVSAASYVVELISNVTSNSSFSPASLAELIAELSDVTIAEQGSMIQVGEKVRLLPSWRHHVPSQLVPPEEIVLGCNSN